MLFFVNCRYLSVIVTVLPDAYFAGCKHFMVMFETEELFRPVVYVAIYKHLLVMFDMVYFAIYHPFLVTAVDASKPFRNRFEPIMVHSSIADTSHLTIKTLHIAYISECRHLDNAMAGKYSHCILHIFSIAII
jgi:hypothetical protein